MLIEMSLEGPFPEHIDLTNNKDAVIRQQVKFEWLPLKCTRCRMDGHSLDTCRRKSKGTEGDRQRQR